MFSPFYVFFLLFFVPISTRSELVLRMIIRFDTIGMESENHSILLHTTKCLLQQSGKEVNFILIHVDTSHSQQIGLPCFEIPFFYSLNDFHSLIRSNSFLLLNHFSWKKLLY